jgi:circadian clock protein KaiB
MKTQTDITFKLYIIKRSHTSSDTILKLKSYLDSNFNAKYQLEVIDILSFPEKAVKDNVMASPTLIKETPSPAKRIIGRIQYNHLITEFNLSNFLN